MRRDWCCSVAALFSLAYVGLTAASKRCCCCPWSPWGAQHITARRQNQSKDDLHALVKLLSKHAAWFRPRVRAFR